MFVATNELLKRCSCGTERPRAAHNRPREPRVVSSGGGGRGCGRSWWTRYRLKALAVWGLLFLLGGAAVLAVPYRHSLATVRAYEAESGTQVIPAEVRDLEKDPPHKKQQLLGRSRGPGVRVRPDRTRRLRPRSVQAQEGRPYRGGRLARTAHRHHLRRARPGDHRGAEQDAGPPACRGRPSRGPDLDTRRQPRARADRLHHPGGLYARRHRLHSQGRPSRRTAARPHAALISRSHGRQPAAQPSRPIGALQSHGSEGAVLDRGRCGRLPSARTHWRPPDGAAKYWAYRVPAKCSPNSREKSRTDGRGRWFITRCCVRPAGFL